MDQEFKMAWRAGPEEGSALEEVRSTLRAGDLERATDLAQVLLAQGVQAPLLLNLAAFRLERQRRFPESLALLQRALEISPDDPTIHNAIGHCLTKQGVAAEAVEAFDAAIARKPNFQAAHHGRGLALEMLDDNAGAVAAHLKAAALDPAYPDPLGSLAALALKAGDYPRARDYARKALAIDPLQASAVLTLASIAMGEKAFEAVIALLAPLIPGADMTPVDRAVAYRLHAEALDALGRHDEALAGYVLSNAELPLAFTPKSDVPGEETGAGLCARLAAYFEASPAEAWTAAPGWPAKDKLKGHVFLVGFPRSGATMLEQVLASHPDVVALSEKPTLELVVAEYFADDASLNRLAKLDAARAALLRTDYWRQVRGYGVDPDGKVVVDKLPLKSLWLPLIAKLFPDARIIFARRDPRDVIVSCFRTSFRVNPAMRQFTSVAGAATFYSSVMALSEIYQGKLSLPLHIHRHEDLVTDFDTEAKAVCAFLDLPWRATAMRDFAKTAKRRDDRPAGAPQPERGFYRKRMGEWRRYQAGLTEAMSILAPWVERFGYPAE